MDGGSDEADERWPHEPDSASPAEPETGWPNEPDEFSPDDVGPTAPSPPSLDEVDDPSVASLFWKLVVVFDVAILALALGPLLVYFRGWESRGVEVFLLGVVAFAYGTYRYRRYQSTSDDESPSDADEGSKEDESGIDGQRNG